MQRSAKCRETETAELALCLVLEEVEFATWPLFRPLLRRLEALGEVPVSLLVSPESHPGKSLADNLHFAAEMDRRLIRGDELLMQGYGGSLDTSGGRGAGGRGADEGECGNGPDSRSLSEHAFQDRLRAGLQQFMELDWPVDGFVASGWHLGDGVRAALEKSSFRYTADREHLIRLADNRSLSTPVAVGSDLGAPWQQAWWSRAHRPTPCTPLEQVPCLRLVVHPIDLQHPDGRDFWLRKLNEMLENRRPLTLAGWLGRAEALAP